MVPCPRCKGAGKRGLFGRSGCGVMSRECKACGGRGENGTIGMGSTSLATERQGLHRGSDMVVTERNHLEEPLLVAWEADAPAAVRLRRPDDHAVQHAETLHSSPPTVAKPPPADIVETCNSETMSLGAGASLLEQNYFNHRPLQTIDADAETEAIVRQERAVIMAEQDLAGQEAEAITSVPHNGYDMRRRAGVAFERNHLEDPVQESPNTQAHEYGTPGAVRSPEDVNAQFAETLPNVSLAVVRPPSVDVVQERDTQTFTSSSGSQEQADVTVQETSCCCLCPCVLAVEVAEDDLEDWEQSGQEMCGYCPRWCHCPVDLGPRQCTWRMAEVNLWFLVLSNVQTLVQDRHHRHVTAYMIVDVTMLSFSLLAAFWVRNRDRVQIITYFFFAIIMKALEMSSTYSEEMALWSQCAFSQSLFRGCNNNTNITDCISNNSCSQARLDVAKCQAPGSDVCAKINSYEGWAWAYAGDAVNLFFALGGLVPLFTAAIARRRRATHSG